MGFRLMKYDHLLYWTLTQELNSYPFPPLLFSPSIAFYVFPVHSSDFNPLPFAANTITRSQNVTTGMVTRQWS